MRGRAAPPHPGIYRVPPPRAGELLLHVDLLGKTRQCTSCMKLEICCLLTIRIRQNGKNWNVFILKLKGSLYAFIITVIINNRRELEGNGLVRLIIIYRFSQG